MAEKEPHFIVNDRRKFTLEGELREGASWTPDEPIAHVPPVPDDKSAPATRAEPPASVAATPVPLPAVPATPSPAAQAPGPRIVSPAQPEPALDNEDGGNEEGGPPPTVEEAAEQHAAYQQSSRVLDKMLREANPELAAPEEANFEQLVQSIYLSAIVQMGGAAKPGEQPRIDIVGARQNIDILGILADKTRGNLVDRESHLLENALFDLRMMFLELTNAIAAQAAKAPPVARK